jgi:hypothetical protein
MQTETTMRKILLTTVALLGFAFPAYAGQDSGNTGLSNNGAFTSAQYPGQYTGQWDVRTHGAFAGQDNGNVLASQDNGNLMASQDSGNLFASQDSGNLPDTLRSA